MKSGAAFYAPQHKDAVHFANSGADVFLFSMDYLSSTVMREQAWRGQGSSAYSASTFWTSSQITLYADVEFSSIPKQKS